MTTVSAIGLELWSMTPDIYFDNVIICSEKEVADRWAADGWGLKKFVASANEPGMFSQLVTAAEDHPWLWVLYILTLGLPIGLGVLFCWPAKKTDEDIDLKPPDISKPITKGEPKQEREELEDDEMEEKENEETAEDEDEGEGGKDIDGDEQEEENEVADGSQEEGDKSNKSGSEDQMKEADESTGSVDGPLKSVCKRRVQKH
ncbi:calmegin-like [Falco naumanni]|uniref:calmegin-like n=1 Tax=Falco naumanni TaxID=148594 RepID=UPI001ADDF89A|nr:calmegin-like [Falco naumanni]